MVVVVVMLVLMLDEDDVADVKRGGSATAADAAAVGDGSGDDDRDGAEPVLEVAPLEVLALAWATSVVLVVFLAPVEVHPTHPEAG